MAPPSDALLKLSLEYSSTSITPFSVSSIAPPLYPVLLINCVTDFLPNVTVVDAMYRAVPMLSLKSVCLPSILRLISTVNIILNDVYFMFLFSWSCDALFLLNWQFLKVTLVRNVSPYDLIVLLLISTAALVLASFSVNMFSRKII